MRYFLQLAIYLINLLRSKRKGSGCKFVLACQCFHLVLDCSLTRLENWASLPRHPEFCPKGVVATIVVVAAAVVSLFCLYSICNVNIMGRAVNIVYGDIVNGNIVFILTS